VTSTGSIVDAHCHAGLGDGLTGPWDTRAPLATYLARAKSAGIGHTVIFAPFSSGYRRANRLTARLVGARPDRLTGFACVHPSADAGHVRTLLDEAVQAGLRGVKVHRHDGAVSREIAGAVARLGLPVIFDVQGRPAIIELLAVEYPGVDWIVPHLGSFSDDWWAQRSVIELIVRHPNVYADTSGVRRFDLLAEAVGRAPNKVIFGSDGPELHPGVELAKIRALRLPPGTEAAVLGGTIRRLLARRTALPPHHPLRNGPPSTRRGSSRRRPAEEAWRVAERADR
jgi:predicted TIM-barrel fold metal-dependent hydrolase